MAVMFRLFIFLSELTVTELAFCSRSVLQLLLRRWNLHNFHVSQDASNVAVLIFDVFEKDNNRIFAAVRKYFPVKFRYL